MQRDGVSLAARLGVADAAPDITPLSGLDRIETGILKLPVDGAETRAVVPQHGERHVQVAEEAVGPLVTVAVGSVQTDNHMLQIVGLADLLDDIAKCRTVDLRQQAGEYQFHRTVPGKQLQIAFQFGRRFGLKIMQGGNDAAL